MFLTDELALEVTFFFKRCCALDLIFADVKSGSCGCEKVNDNIQRVCIGM